MSTCLVCQKAGADLACGVCGESVCKKCAIFLEPDRFLCLPNVPAVLKHTTYCGPCYDAHVAEQIESYEELLERARNITVYYTADSKQTRNIRRQEKPYKIEKCADKDEVLMKLAVLAAQGGFNALLDVDIIQKKVRSGTYQTSDWSGTGTPATLTSKRFL